MGHRRDRLRAPRRFVDSSFWVALTRPKDQWHGHALTLMHSATGPLVTSSHVVGETWTTLQRRVDRRAAVDLLDRIEQAPRLRIVHVGQSTEQAAWEWLRRHDEREYSFVDATSFAVMREMSILDALAFDGDFAAAGFVELRP